MNHKKAKEIRKAIKKISSVAHFSQSMADYFARDYALEPALAVVCEALRNTEDIGGLMERKAVSFLGWVQPYEKERSGEDHDVTSLKKTSKTTYRKKPCFTFQKKGRCGFKNCIFEHECEECGSSSHGAIKCRREHVKKKDRKKSRSRRSSDY